MSGAISTRADRPAFNNYVWQSEPASRASRWQLLETTVAPSPTGWPRVSQWRWVESVVRQARTLARLRRGWDRHDGEPVRRDIVDFLPEVLGALNPDTPAPRIVPMSDGTLQLEWHVADLDLEIEIVEPYHLVVAFDDRRRRESREFEILSGDLSRLSEPIRRLTEGHD